MIGREIESLEYMIIVVDLRSVSDIEAHAYEDLTYFVLNLCKRVELTERSVSSGESDVDSFFFKLSGLSF